MAFLVLKNVQIFGGKMPRLAYFSTLKHKICSSRLENEIFSILPDKRHFLLYLGAESHVTLFKHRLKSIVFVDRLIKDTFIMQKKLLARKQ